MLSTHKVEVVPVFLEKHPNADTLSVVTVFGGFPCCVRTADWEGKTKGAYIPPDSVVDVSRPEFAFLAKGTKAKHRVKCVKLRGVMSFGLLLPVDDDAQIGDDLAMLYGVEHYEPEMKSACTGGEAEKAPEELATLSRYDVDTLRRHRTILSPGELVLVTEKIHGANSRYSYIDGRMWCGSRGEWKRDEPENLWWKALRGCPQIGDFCRLHPGYVLYGEVYGDVQSLRYGCRKGEVKFAAFDILHSRGHFLDATEGRWRCMAFAIPVVPQLAICEFDFARVCAMAEGLSTLPGADHVREGCVVKPLTERWHQVVGRVQLKVVSAGYMERS